MIDALDEADNTGLSPGVNSLFLPVSLPPGVYIIATTRRESLEQRKDPVHLRIDCEHDTLYINHDSMENLSDVRSYLEEAVKRPRLRACIAKQRIDEQLFVKLVIEKSQGNFMYLHYVLPEIEGGAYTDLDLKSLPSGLRNYYEDHWRRMRGQDENVWFNYKLPVVMALTVVRAPVSIDLISDFAGVREKAVIRSVLSDWAQFLHVEEVPYEGIIQRRYRVYHNSFEDFLRDKEEVADECVSRRVAHQQIAESLLRDWDDA